MIAQTSKMSLVKNLNMEKPLLMPISVIKVMKRLGKGTTKRITTYHPVQMIQWWISLTMSLLSQFVTTPKKLQKLPKLLRSLCQDHFKIGGLDLRTGLLFMVIRKHGF